MPANLGLVSNEEMMRELICRFKMEVYNSGAGTISVNGSIDRALVLSEMLGGMSAPEREYSTVDFTETTEETRTTLKFPTKKTPKKKRARLTGEAMEQRNARIIAMYEQGYTYGQIAREVNLRDESVRQIVVKAQKNNQIKSEPPVEISQG